MAMHYALVSHGTVLGHTATEFPADELPAGTNAWHFVPTAAFDAVEPIIAELSAPPAISLVEDVLPTRDEYLHPGWNEHEAQMERLMSEASRIHHFRLVLERYERLDLELRDLTGRRLPTSSVLVTKQLVPADALRAYAESIDPHEAQLVDPTEPCYLLLAREDQAAAASAA